jgi:hypothetical protein
VHDHGPRDASCIPEPVPERFAFADDITIAVALSFAVPDVESVSVANGNR